MTEAHSTHTPAPRKPAKPYPEFPLFPHATGRWAKKIRGKLHYFGKWDEPDAALAKYQAEKDDLHAGRKHRPVAGSLTVKDLCNQCLNAKRAAVESGEMANRTWQDYKDACDHLVAHFGKSRLVADLDPDDFAALRNKMSKMWGPGTLGVVIQRMRVVFKYAWDNGLIDRPVRYGQQFKRPTKKTLRRHRAEQGLKLFTADEIRRLVEGADPVMRAMLLLGINCGFGNSDCGHLPQSAVDLDAGVIDYPRPKTGIARRCPLWPETVAALRAALACRPEPKRAEYAGMVFLRKGGLPWARDTPDSPISKEVRVLADQVGVSRRNGLGFYTLRHTFRTVADESKDQPAVDFIMGHEVPHMSAVYRETISDARLKAVTDYVRRWLFSVPAATEPGPADGDSAPQPAA